jgi:hypothetical protein
MPKRYATRLIFEVLETLAIRRLTFGHEHAGTVDAS